MSSTALQIWEYRDTDEVLATPESGAQPVLSSAPHGLTEEQVEARLREALGSAEHRWAEKARAAETQCHQHVQAVLQGFEVERSRYFRTLEGEVVQLALAVSRKILAREARLDPDLLAGLVRVALDRLGAGAAVRVCVAASDLSLWEQTGAFQDSPYLLEVVADASVTPGDCRIETDRGSATLGLESQLKTIEEGLLDLLARRPPVSGGQAAPLTAQVE